MDQHLAGVCKNIHVTLEKDGSRTVEDNGRGVPVGMHQKGICGSVLCIRHCMQAENSPTIVPIRRAEDCTVLVLRLSMRCPFIWNVQISREGYIHHDRYERGVPVVELEGFELLPTIGKTRKTGTKVNFLPDDTIFEKTKLRAEEVKSRLHETAY